MKLSNRELIIAWLTGAVVLGALTFFICKPQFDKASKSKQNKAFTLTHIESSQRLVDQGPKWHAALADLEGALPEYPQRKNVSAEMMAMLDKMASDKNVKLLRRDPEKEKPYGQFFELPVTCRWEGELEAITRFLFDVQSKTAMLDVKHLRIEPKGKDNLKGVFTITSVYSKTDD